MITSGVLDTRQTSAALFSPFDFSYIITKRFCFFKNKISLNFSEQNSNVKQKRL